MPGARLRAQALAMCSLMAVAAVSPEAVLYWPVCDPWLAEQVRDPSSQFTHHRDGGLA